MLSMSSFVWSLGHDKNENLVTLLFWKRRISMAYEIPTTRYTLLKKAQNGDKNAVNELCEIYFPAIKKWSLNKCKGRAVDADELASDSLLRFVEKTIKSFKFRPGQKLRAHLQAVIHHVCQELERAYYKNPHEIAESHFLRELAAPEASSEIEFQIERDRELHLLSLAVERVKTGYENSRANATTFQAFELRQFHNKPYSQIAAEIDITAQAAKMNHCRVKAKVKETLKALIEQDKRDSDDEN